MFKRRRVQPAVDEYIVRRYEDTAVCIYRDIQSGRGMRNYYAPWLEGMLQRLPASHSDKYSLMTKSVRPVLSAWAEEPELGVRESPKEPPQERLASEGGETVGGVATRGGQGETHTSSRFCVIL